MRNESLSSPQLAIREQDGVAVALTHKQILSIFKKSENSGHSFDTLKEVYKRGYAENLSEQDGFNRVNSFVAGGAAADMDKDLFEKRGLWDNIHAKRERIKRGSGEHMRKPGSKGAPTDAALKAAQEETTYEARKSPWDKMASALKKHTGKDLNASDARAKEALAGLKQSHQDYQAIVDKDKVKKEAADPCWQGYKQVGMKMKNNRQVPNCVPESYTGAEKVSPNPNDPTNRFAGTDSLTDNYKKATPGQSSTLSTVKRVVREQREEIEEAKYHGKEVPLNKPMKGDVKKSKVFVKDPATGNVKKVNFGDKTLSIKKNIPARKRSYCARSSGQGNLNKKTSANYWSRRAWDC